MSHKFGVERFAKEAGLAVSSARVLLRKHRIPHEGKAYGWDSLAEVKAVVEKCRSGKPPKAAAKKIAKKKTPAKAAKKAPAKPKKKPKTRKKAPAKKPAPDAPEPPAVQE